MPTRSTLHFGVDRGGSSTLRVHNATTLLSLGIMEQTSGSPVVLNVIATLAPHGAISTVSVNSTCARRTWNAVCVRVAVLVGQQVGHGAVRTVGACPAQRGVELACREGAHHEHTALRAPARVIKMSRALELTANRGYRLVIWPAFPGLF